MIAYDVFFDILKRFALCVDRPLRKEQVEELYKDLKFKDETVFRDAVEVLINDESKLTLAAIRRAIAMAGKKAGETRSGSHFNGIGCHDCSMGLINTVRIINGIRYSFVYRCRCESYDAPFLPIYNGDGLDESRLPQYDSPDIQI